MKRSLIKSTTIISLGTLSSRVLGFVRDVIIARMLGTGIIADAFFVAFRIPNLFRDVVAEGAANSAIVPVISRYVGKDDRSALRQFVSVLFYWSIGILTVLTAVGIIFAPQIVAMMAPGFAENIGQEELTVTLTRILFPYLIFIGLTAYCTGILYTFRSYVIPAFSPCLLNIAFILGAIISVWILPEPVYGLAVAVLVGGAAQWLIQIKPLRALGITIEKPQSLSHPEVRRVGQLLLPRLMGSGIYQLNIFIDTFCASLSSIVGSGGISAIYYANRIIQFPIGVFGLALASVLLPTLSGLAVAKDTAEYKKTFIFAMQSIFVIMLPMSVLCVTLAEPIIRVIFERGEFTSHSTQITSLVLFFYAMGLVSFSGTKILVTAFHALQDTKTPVKVAAVSLVMTLVLNLILMRPFKAGGIALASAITSTVSFIFLLYFLNRRLGGFVGPLGRFLLKVVLAAILMGAVVVLLWPLLSFAAEPFRLILIAPIGLLVFLGACLFLKVDHMKEMFKWILRIK